MRGLRDVLIFHALFGAAALAVFSLLKTPQLGLGILALVVAYNVLAPIIAYRAGHRDWFNLWLFLLPLSMFQVVPDWVLSQLIGILHFPDVGAPRIGTVPIYMAGMWVIPLFWALWPARQSVLMATALSLLIFGISEWAAPLIRLWAPDHVRMTFGIANYVLLPEALLGGAAAIAYRWSLGHGALARLGSAAAVSVFYTGALVVCYFLLERARV